jgi:hypothetical protein
MLGGFIGGLFIAWILTWFNVQTIIIAGVFDLFGFTLTIPAYYVVAGIIGAITALFTPKVYVRKE